MEAAMADFLLDPGFAEPWQQPSLDFDFDLDVDRTFRLDDLPDLGGGILAPPQVCSDREDSRSPTNFDFHPEDAQFPLRNAQIVEELQQLVIRTQQEQIPSLCSLSPDENLVYCSSSSRSPSPPPPPPRQQDDLHLLTMLQRCIATHMTNATPSATAAATVASTKKSNKKVAAAAELAVGLQTMMKRRRRQESPAAVAVAAAATYVRGALSRDVMTLLHDCAYAVATRDVAAASDLAAAIRQRHGAAPLAADSRLRLAYYFSEALIARALGTGRELSGAAGGGGADATAAAAEMETVYAFRIHHTPSPLLPHFFSTQAILRSISRAGDADVLHIVDIGMARNRFQWSLLLHALAMRPPCKLRITAFDTPQHRSLLEQLGRRIVAQATELGIPCVEYESALFEPAMWEAGISRIPSSSREILVVNALFALDWLGDELAVWARSRRRGMLTRIAKLHPDVVILGINDGRMAASEMRFLDRFCQAVRRFGAKFDYAEECTAAAAAAADDPGRLAYEGRFLAPEIVNLVACDGEDRMVRTAPYEEWSSTMESCGFQMEPMDAGTFARANSMICSNFNRHFEVERDDGWMKLSWKKITTQCVSSWIISDRQQQQQQQQQKQVSR